MPDHVSQVLADQYLAEPHAEYVQHRGFRDAEVRLCLGGECVRAWNPVFPSASWGTNYEHWKFTGPAAAANVGHLLTLDDVRPSRVDVAFDLHSSPWSVHGIREAVENRLSGQIETSMNESGPKSGRG